MSYKFKSVLVKYVFSSHEFFHFFLIFTSQKSSVSNRDFFNLIS